MSTKELETFKRAVGEYAKEAPTLTDRELEAGFRAVSKAYLNLPTDPLTLVLAVPFLEYATSVYLKQQSVLLYGHDPMERLKQMAGMVH